MKRNQIKNALGFLKPAHLGHFNMIRVKCTSRWISQLFLDYVPFGYPEYNYEWKVFKYYKNMDKRTLNVSQT